jgi:glutamate racemase
MAEIAEMDKKKPIGVFDSGLGGLSICRAIQNILPEEQLMYFADLEFSPYGNKSIKMISERSEFIVKFLIDQGCKLIVIACNTATVNSISILRSKYSIPIIGVEPGIKPATLVSKNGVIGVLATEQTIKSDLFQQLKARYSNTVRIETKACPNFVDLVENLEHESEVAIEAAEHYVRPLLLAGCDQIILGCTHFSFLMPAIAKVVGNKADIIDTAVPVAMEVKRKLTHFNIRSDGNDNDNVTFWTSGCSIKTTESMHQLWGQGVSVSQFRP